MKSGLILLVPALALAFLTTATLAQDESGEQAEPAATVEVADSEQDRAAKAEARAKANSWWHADGVAEALKLSEEQREQMDQKRRENEEQKNTNADTRRALEAQLQAAYLEGDLDAARKLASDLQAAAPVEDALKLEILSLLSQEQLGLLKEKYSRILSENWRRNTRRLVENKEKSGKGRGRGGKNRGNRAKDEPEKQAKDAEDAAGKDD